MQDRRDGSWRDEVLIKVRGFAVRVDGCTNPVDLFRRLKGGLTGIIEMVDTPVK